jgi:hypothetical protein
MKRTTAWCLGFFGALTFYWSAATLGGGFDWVRHYRLAKASAHADAIVTRTEPDNHCTADYTFEVGGRQYRSSGQGRCGVHVGDKLRVYYLPDDPVFSTFKVPGEDLAFMIVGPLTLSVVAGFVVMVRTKRPSSNEA